MNIKIVLQIFIILSILLTSQLNATKNIVLASFNHEPYIGPTLAGQGYVFELITESFKEVGYKVEIQYFPLLRAKRMAQNGNVDAYVPAYKKEFSKNYFEFSMPFYGDNIGLLKKKSLIIDNLEENIKNPEKLYDSLKQYSFGFLRGMDGIPIFDDAKFLKKESVSKNIQNIDMLFLDRINFVLIDKYTASDIIVRYRPHMIGELEYINPPLLSENFHVAFSKKALDYKIKLKDFNRGLKSLMKKGIVDKILAKHGLLLPKIQNSEKIKLVIGTVDNEEMLIMQDLSDIYEKENPHIELEWRVLSENTLRKRLLSDMAISDGQFDVMTIGAYEVPIWAKKKWITPLVNIPKEYNLNDILKPLKESLSFDNQLYALPFYAESSMTFYRKDLFKKAGIKMPINPTYHKIKNFAEKIHDPINGIYGICLRGKAGWGENMAYFNTLLNSFGGSWFDKDWKPTINSIEWKNALTFYKELVTKYAPKSTPFNNFNENKKLFLEGHCGMWIDATVAASELFDPIKSKFSKNIAYSKSPIGITKKDSNWLWIWSLSIPSSSKYKKEALDFITWATSEEYIKLVSKNYGWHLVPPGTRASTYENKNYQKEAVFSDFVYSSIKSIDIKDNIREKRFYYGLQFISIPEYQSLGDNVGYLVQEVIEGKITVEEALLKAQKIVYNQMVQSGYIK